MLISIPGAVAHQLGATTGRLWVDFSVEAAFWLAYYAFFTASAWQATPGKLAFAIKVTDLQGRRIGLARSVLRHLATYLSAFALAVGYLMVLFTRKRQGLHDLIAGTLVVSAATPAGTVPPDRHVLPLGGRTSALAAAALFLFLAYVMASAFLLQPEAQTRAAVPAGPATGPASRLHYALYDVPLWGRDPRLVREGTLDYRLSDVQVLPGPDGTPDSLRKTLAVVDGFSIEAHIYREPAISGFGLTLEKTGGFSWEWFDLESGYVFRKRQGPGRIQVRLHRADDKEEIAEVLFLDDIALRTDRYWLIPFTGRESDRLVIRRGSVLKLAD